MAPPPTSYPTYEQRLRQIIETDERVVVMTAENRAAIRGLPPLLGKRFIDVGIAEQTMIGAAAGLALRGRRPLVHALATFLTLRAFEFIRTDLGIGKLPTVLVGGVPGFLSDGNGPTHQAVEDVGILRGIPGMQVYCPADEAELSEALPALVESAQPTYVRHNFIKPTVAISPFEFGKADVLEDGEDIALLTYGFLVREALGAAAALRSQGYSVRVVHVRTPKPLDEKVVLETARKARLLVTIEDHFLTGGLFSIVSELFLRHRLAPRVLPIALAERWFKPATLPRVLDHEGFTAEKLAARVGAFAAEHLGKRTTQPAAKDPSITRSNHLWARSEGLIPAGTQTLAKGPGQWTEGVAPKYVARGKGARVWDVDGNEFIDLTMAVGPLSLGYGHPEVDAAIREQLDSGITFSLMHPLEVELAELVRDVVPNTEMVRYSKTGCDVTTAAVRLARAFTKREKVFACGYHGWHDWYIAVTDRNAGIPQGAKDLSYTIKFNDLESVRDSIDEDTACVILEPMVFEQPKPGFLEGLREICDRKGALLVFDEMWTGFRLALGGAQEKFGVRSDLACFSKAVANGMPLSLLTGRREIMQLLEKDVFFFTTFGGEALSLAAAKKTIEVLRRDDVPARLAAQGKKLRDGYNRLAENAGLAQSTSCFGYDARTIVTFKDERASVLAQKTFVQQEMIARGILWGGFHNVSLAHGDAEVDAVLAAYAEVLPLLAKGLAEKNLEAQLRGKLLEPVFRRVDNFHMKPKK